MRGKHGGLAVVAGRDHLDTAAAGAEPLQRPYDAVRVGGQAGTVVDTSRSSTVFCPTQATDSTSATTSATRRTACRPRAR